MCVCISDTHWHFLSSKQRPLCPENNFLHFPIGYFHSERYNPHCPYN